MRSPIVATCSCGRSYTLQEFLALALPHSGREWQVMAPDPEATYWPAGARLRYRNCPCKSTITLEYPYFSDWQPTPAVWLRAEERIPSGAPHTVRAFVPIGQITSDPTGRPLEEGWMEQERDHTGARLPRRHQVKALVEAFALGGQEVPPVVLSRSPSGRGYVIEDGRHRVAAAARAGVLEVPALVLAG